MIYPSTANINTKLFSIRQTKNKGFGIFSKSFFKKGELLFYVKGPRILYEDIEDDSYVDHHCLQIAKTLYIGPSGTEDDFINHSCNPNAGISMYNDKIVYIAIKTVKPNQEITFDYSTSMDEAHSEYICTCGSKLCRGRIEDFSQLPEKIKQKYLKLNIVMPFIANQYSYTIL